LVLVAIYATLIDDSNQTEGCTRKSTSIWQFSCSKYILHYESRKGGKPMALSEIYIGCTVFSVGITALDILGVLGGNQDSEGGDGGGDADGGGDVDGGDVDGGNMHDGGDVDIGEGHHDGATDGGTVVTKSDPTVGVEASGMEQRGGVAVLSVLAYLRYTVYFCLGFGPTGWVVMATGRSAPSSLIWAVPAGAVAFGLAYAFFRLQRSDTDSSLHSKELHTRSATVIVPLSHKTMGKVRVQVGMSVTDQYALAAEPDAQFEKGESVWISDVTAECVYVIGEFTEKEEEK
jgi:hypothetical protein